MSLVGLVERLEAATGPDLELDIDILTTVLGYRDIYGDRRLFDRGNEGYWSQDDLPSPTGSLDAAMSLVPDMGFCEINWYRGHSADGKDDATVWPVYGGDQCFHVEAATPALALCAAALRARAS